MQVVSRRELEEDALLFVKPDGRDISDRVEGGSDDQVTYIAIGHFCDWSSGSDQQTKLCDWHGIFNRSTSLIN